MAEVENKDNIGWEAKKIAGTPIFSNKLWAIFSRFDAGLSIGSVTSMGCSWISWEFKPNSENIWLNNFIIANNYNNSYTTNYSTSKNKISENIWEEEGGNENKVNTRIEKRKLYNS